MRFNRLTNLLLVLPSTALILVIAFVFLADFPQDQSRQATGYIFNTLVVSCFFSFAGVASASNTMKVYPQTKTLGNALLALYGAVPFLYIAAVFIFGMAATAKSLVAST